MKTIDNWLFKKPIFEQKEYKIKEQDIITPSNIVEKGIDTIFIVWELFKDIIKKILNKKW